MLDDARDGMRASGMIRNERPCFGSYPPLIAPMGSDATEATPDTVLDLQPGAHLGEAARQEAAFAVVADELERAPVALLGVREPP